MNYVMPFVAYNAIFYSISTLSTSISSTQNIFKFIVDHKDSDYIFYQHQLETTDLNNKLNIITALIKDIIKKYYVKKEDIEHDKKVDIDNLLLELFNPKYNLLDESEIIETKSSTKSSTNSSNTVLDKSINNSQAMISFETNNFTIIELVKNSSIDIIIPEPIKISLLSTLEIINKINNILEKVKNKILQHEKSYLKNIIKINIYNEINEIINLTNLFNLRLDMLFKLLKIYQCLHSI
jgi:hypothetical protein